MKLKLSDIKLNPDNPRTIKDNKFKLLVQSLKDFPEMAEVREVVVNKDHVILGGNMRFRAMQEAGWTEIPVKVVDWPEDKQREFVAKDNASFGEWDWEILANEWDLDELESWGIDVPVDTRDIDEVEEDEAPEVSSEPPVSKLGEIYQLGRHRVMCGDSTEKANVELLMNGEKADMVFTDPPYGMDLDADFSSLEARGAFASRSGGSKYDNVIGDNKDYDPSFILEHFNYVDEIFMWGADYYAKHIPSGGSYIVWDKRVTDSLDKAVGSCFELCWSKSKHKRDIARITWAGIFGFNKTEDGGKREHPTQKPIKLVAWFFDKYKGNVVVDLFLGSGSTLIACEQTDRTCYGMELDPKYTDVIRRRYWKYVNNGDESEWEQNTPAIGVK